jgi:tellurite resistance protein TehA-like permease
VGVVDRRCGGRCVGDGVAVIYSVFPATDHAAKQADDGRISQTYITSLERITALQLLPIAATIVAAGTGAEVAEILPDPQHAMGTVLVSYILWGMGTPLAMTILVIYYQRLAVHKLPSRETIVSCFLPLGPLGFGGFG